MPYRTARDRINMIDRIVHLYHTIKSFLRVLIQSICPCVALTSHLKKFQWLEVLEGRRPLRPAAPGTGFVKVPMVGTFLCPCGIALPMVGTFKITLWSAGTNGTPCGTALFGADNEVRGGGTFANNLFSGSRLALSGLRCLPVTKRCRLVPRCHRTPGPHALNPGGEKSGMTLIELLVVLALMAGLATFALTSMDGLTARNRYDITRERMELVNHLLLGNGREPGRFVSDMGRLPTNISELLVRTVTFSPTECTESIGTAPQVTTVTGTLLCGLNGPYLLSPGGSNRFYDGFGQEFAHDDSVMTYLAATGMGRHASWLPDTLSNSFTSVTNCYLTVQVMAPNPTQAEQPCWDLVQSTNRVTNRVYDAATYGFGAIAFSNGLLYRKLTASGADTPPDTADTTNWKLIGHHNYPTHANVVLVVPNGSSPVKKRINPLHGNPCTFSNLYPGTRTVMAYGYNNGIKTNGWWSGFHTVELRAGMNFITLYLTQPLQP